ncbi:MAG: hypothetical protein IH818_01580 [Acidobacteria bacterium]|nr:hypothetical protein [Acidobacteriota bacterium]
MSEMSDEKLVFGVSDRVELIATILMALAAIFTAWAAFQSAKWSGEQATSFSRAGAARTESTRFDTRAGQQAGIDVAIFTSWLDAINAELRAGEIEPLEESEVYTPTPGTLSAFYFDRMRPEFKVALEAWLQLKPLVTEGAPPSPFAMDEYVLENAVEAARLQDVADQHALDAAEANQTSDDYVLTVVAFALVLFFGGISSKLSAVRNSYLTIGVALFLFSGATLVLLSLPKILPF